MYPKSKTITHEGVLYFISNEPPLNDDLVLTENYGVWIYKDHPSMLPFWCNNKTCKKLILMTNKNETH